MDRQAAIDLILDHYENPRHYGVLAPPALAGESSNPGCGDVIHLTVQIDAQGRIAGIGFEGQGCTISQASASLFTELAAGRSLVEVQAFDENTLAEILGADIVSSRMPCVSLVLRAFRKACSAASQ